MILASLVMVICVILLMLHLVGARLHYLVLVTLIKIRPNAFLRYFDEYNEAYVKAYLGKKEL